MKFKPTLNRVIIKSEIQETKTMSGIVLPGAEAEKPDQGVVLAVGPGRLVEGVLVPVGVEVGDKVVFRLHAGQNVKVGSESFVILEEIDILAVVN